MEEETCCQCFENPNPKPVSIYGYETDEINNEIKSTKNINSSDPAYSGNYMTHDWLSTKFF